MPSGKPNILVIWGDDIGISNLSCYSRGLMGYFTPNIDRIADEGMLFTDSYGEQSCTAGRSSFITGQSVYRTGMSEVGMPGVVGLVSPGMPGPTLGWVDGLGELPGALVCASAGATLTTRASSTVNAMCQDLIWTLLARFSARGFAIEMPAR